MDLVRALFVSGCLGAFIGLERQWDRQLKHPERRVFAGLRTFTLWAALGTLCAWLSTENHELFFLAGFIAIASFVGIFLVYRNRSKPGAGLTTAAVALLTYLIGGIVFWGEWVLAVGLAVGINLILFNKSRIHAASRHFTIEDVRMVLQFAVLTGIILPLVPDQAYGPFDAFNPRSIWMMVVLVSGVGFLGYLAIRLIGATNGITVTGLLGGVASSTATTLAMSRQSKAAPELAGEFALAVILACSVMPVRVGILVGAISIPLISGVWIALALFVLPGILLTGLHFLRKRKEKNAAELDGEFKNPLSLRIALQFGALYAVVVFAVKAASHYFGNEGVYLASAISGLTDLDAIALSLAEMLNEAQVPAQTAARGVIIATVANTVMKAGLSVALGARGMRPSVLIFAGATALMGIVGWFLV